MRDLTKETSTNDDPVRPRSSFQEIWRQNWDFTSKIRPSDEEAEQAIAELRKNWHEIAGDIAEITFPKRFSGAKLRKLTVIVTGSGTPPWGGWDYLGAYDYRRRSFTILREKVNQTISPHEVDHIEFLTK